VPDGSVSAALPTGNTGVTVGASLNHAGDSAVQHEEPGSSHGQTDATAVDVSPLEVMKECVVNWVQVLDHEDKKSVAILLCFVSVNELRPELLS
jgi:hypothetical protein